MADDLLAAMHKLTDVLKKANLLSQEGARQQEDVRIRVDVSGRLQAASSPAQVQKMVSEVLGRNLGGRATFDIRQHMTSAAKQQQQMRAEARDRASMFKALQNARLQQASFVPGSVGHQVWGQTAAIARTGIQQSRARSRNLRVSRARHLVQAKQLALGNKSLLTKTNLSLGLSAFAGLAKIIPGVGTAFAAATKAVAFFSKNLSESSDIVAKYSHFSIGGLQAASIEYYGELQRNIKSSHELSKSMVEFSVSNNRAKNAFRGMWVEVDKLKLFLGTVTSDFLAVIGPPITSVFKSWVDQTFGPAMTAYRTVKEWLGFRDQDEAMNRIMRRQQFFHGLRGGRGQPPMEPGDIGGWEAFMLELQGFMPGAAGKFRERLNNNRAVPFRPGRLPGGGVIAAGGMNFVIPGFGGVPALGAAVMAGAGGVMAGGAAARPFGGAAGAAIAAGVAGMPGLVPAPPIPGMPGGRPLDPLVRRRIARKAADRRVILHRKAEQRARDIEVRKLFGPGRVRGGIEVGEAGEIIDMGEPLPDAAGPDAIDKAWGGGIRPGAVPAGDKFKALVERENILRKIRERERKKTVIQADIDKISREIKARDAKVDRDTEKLWKEGDKIKQDAFIEERIRISKENADIEKRREDLRIFNEKLKEQNDMISSLQSTYDKMIDASIKSSAIKSSSSTVSPLP